MNYYEENIALLKHKNSSIPSPYKPKTDNNIEIVHSKAGHPSLRYNNNLIHSNYDPVKEGEKIAKGFRLKKDDVVLLYGFGLGYHIEQVLKIIGKGGKLYVVELNNEIFSLALSLRDLRGILSQKNFDIISALDQKELVSTFSRIVSSEKEDIKVVIHQPSLKSIPDNFEKVKNAFEVMMISRRTPKFFKEIEKKNVSKNVDLILQSPGVKRFYGKFKNIPGMLIGAGPSIDSAIHDIRKNQDRMLIVCVDTVFSYVMGKGIIPDFVVTIDPQPISLEHFVSNTDSDIPLIFTPTSNCQVVSRYHGERFVVIKNDQSFLFPLKDLLRFKGTTVGGGSVSCTALDLLMNFGNNPIILAGLDCAFPSNRVYSHGSCLHDRFLESVDHSHTVERLHEGEISKKKTVFVHDQFGREILSHQNLYGYLREAEEIIEYNKDRTVFNLSSKGAMIKGTTGLSSVREIVPSMLKNPDKKSMRHFYNQEEKFDPSIREGILQLLN